MRQPTEETLHRTRATVFPPGTGASRSSGQLESPHPAYRRLEAFVGQWRAKGVLALDGKQPVRVTSDNHYEWLPGGFFLVHRYRSHLANGTVISGLEIIQYDAENDFYTSHGFDSLGLSPTFEVTVAKRVWRFDGAKERETIRFMPDGATMQILWERPEGTAWVKFGELESHRTISTLT